MKKKEIKEKAQDLILDVIGQLETRIYDNDPYMEVNNLTEEEKDQLVSEVKKQFKRIAKLFNCEVITE